jgi:alcohol dehydrogenase class IV
LNERIGIPASLADIGITRDQLDALAEQAGSITRLLRNNGRAASPSDLRQILEAAWLGDRSVLNGVQDARDREEA